MNISSRAFSNGSYIPVKHSGLGDDISPDLEWDHVPAETKELVLIVDDPDAPMGTWHHWVAPGISPSKHCLKEGEHLGQDGVNSWGHVGYGGPMPPAGSAHRYLFKLYALDKKISYELSPHPKQGEVLYHMRGHILDQTELMGWFKRN